MSANFEITVNVDEVTPALARISERMRAKILLRAVAAGAAPVLEDMRANAPQESGLLKKSIKMRQRVYKGGLMRVAVIGPAKGFKQVVTVQRSGKKAGRIKATRAKGAVARAAAGRPMAIFRDPVKYAHLVEGGRKAVRPKTAKVLYSALHNIFFPKKGVRAVAARPFVARAVARRRQASLAAIREKLASGLKESVRR